MADKPEYDIQALAEGPGAQPPSRLGFVHAWTPFMARAAKMSINCYLLVRLLFLVTLSSNIWMWIFFYVEWALAREFTQIQSLIIATGKYGDPNLAQHCQRLRLRDGNDNKSALPLVDILIPCCGEALGVILDTVRGACRIDYPKDRFRVLLLDDGQSEALREEIQLLQKTWSNLHYHCRGASNPSRQVFSKAGNLNYALFDIQEPMEQPPEFIAILDADFIPSPFFLRATLPHLLRFPKLAIAGASQDFYNLPPGDPLVQSLDNWQNRLIPHLNQLGSCFHAHSGSVIRRSVLIQHHGFPTISYSEDVLFSNILLGTGSQIISLRQEVLQLGRCPESLQGHVAQRTRWGIGLCQMVMGLRATSNNTVPPHLRWPIAQQGAMILFSLVNRTVVHIAIPLVLLSGQTLVPAVSPLYFKIQGVFAVVSLGLIWIFELSLTAKSGFGGPPFGDLEELWMSPAYLSVIFNHLFFKAKSSGSSVTGSTLNPWNSSTTDGVLTRLKRDFWDAGAIVNLLFLISTIFSMLYTAFYNNQHGGGNLLVSLMWPPTLNICYLIISSNWIPLACAFAPPSWSNAITRAMKPGEMDSYAMFSLARPDIQSQIRPPRRPMGLANHQLLVPLVLAVLLITILQT